MSRTKRAEVTEPDTSVATMEPAIENQDAEPPNSPAVETAAAPEPSNGHAAAVGKKEYKRAPDPFGFESRLTGQNRVELLKSEGKQAWVIRFAHNPNEDTGPEGETYSKENPHPVLKMLKENGFSWNWDVDGKPGWGKRFSNEPYGRDHDEARQVLKQAMEMLGQPKGKEIPF